MDFESEATNITLLNSNLQTDSVKIVVVGGTSVGKTCMIMCYTSDSFPESSVPTIFDSYTQVINYERQSLKLEIWDTSGDDAYRRLRAVSYPKTNCFLVCFSVVDRSSFNDACQKFREELNLTVPIECPRILVGLKTDLREII